MLVELSILPIRGETHLSADIAELVAVIDASGLRYQLTPFGTCLEGRWDEVMAVVAKCHARARELAPHVFTTIRIEDDDGERNKLEHNVTSVAAKVSAHLDAAQLTPASSPSPEAAEVVGAAGQRVTM